MREATDVLIKAGHAVAVAKRKADEQAAKQARRGESPHRPWRVPCAHLDDDILLGARRRGDTEQHVC